MKRILLVDDQPDVLRGIRRLLHGHFHVDVAGDAETAAELLERRAYDAVLTDFNLPGRDGLWLLERTKERRPAARRVLISGRSEKEFDGVQVVERFVRKPATTQELLAALER